MSLLQNSVSLIGRLGAAPEIFNSENGNKIATMRVATNDFYTNQKGEKVETTEWHTVKYYGKLADVAEKFLSKGDEVALLGKLTYRFYEDKAGKTQSTTEIIGSELKLFSTVSNKTKQEAQPA